MDEKLDISPEHRRSHEQGAEAKGGQEGLPGGSERAKKYQYQENLAEIRARAEKEAVSAERVMAQNEEDHVHQPPQAFVNKELKEMAYERTLSRVRRQLSPMGRLTSRVVHQPVVNVLSEGAAKTIGRPSGILGGGLVALVGTSVYYYITKHYGYEYNYFVFLVLLASGLILGWLMEFFWRIFHPTK